MTLPKTPSPNKSLPRHPVTNVDLYYNPANFRGMRQVANEVYAQCLVGDTCYSFEVEATVVNYAQARANMVEQQIRTWDVLDQSVLDSVAAIPRDEFVPPSYRTLAYSDTSIPLGHGEKMMPPKLEARIVQTLNLKPDDRVLEVGTGSGYLTALMARLAGHVTSIELRADFIELAVKNLQSHGLINTHLEEGDGIDGFEAREPFEAIVMTGSLCARRAVVERQLTIGGRLFCVVGKSPAMEAILISRVGENEFITESLFETELAPLIGGETVAEFTF